MLVSVSPMRLWRSKQGLRWALRCRALRGKTWEVLLGHMTSGPAPTRRAQCALCPQQIHSGELQRFCKTVAKCQSQSAAFLGLLPAIVSCWTRGRCSSTVATDASEDGFGVRLRECKKGVCETIGPTSERARFRKCYPDTPDARTAFFDQHRLGFDPRGDLVDLDEKRRDCWDKRSLLLTVVSRGAARNCACQWLG